MNEFWNARYARQEYAYGTEPNVFFKQELDKLPVSGAILLPAEGEGRNAVYAAGQGWKVTGFDFSIEARKKAMSLAASKGVNIDYLIRDINNVVFTENSFDALGLIYVHPIPAHKSTIIKNLTSFLKPGGHVIMEVFSKGHTTYQKANPDAGGPKDPDRFYSTEEIELMFENFEINTLEEQVVELAEGQFHKGEAAVLRFTGIKK